MKRRLIVQIDADDDRCGECPKASGAYCNVFGVGRSQDNSHEFVRLTGCLAAEAATQTQSNGGTP